MGFDADTSLDWSVAESQPSGIEPRRHAQRLTIKEPQGIEMNIWMMAVLSVGSPLAGVGILSLQARLERWDQERHAED